MARKIAGILAGMFALMVVAYGALSLISQPVDEHPFFEQDEVLVIAHQGGEGLRPSNTLAAFSNAVELGVDVLEMDIHGTVDDALVVIHDDTVDRTTNGSGRVQSMTLEELQALDAGYYWTDDGGQTYPYRGQGITIPTLGDVFTAFPEMRMNIEIKQESPSIVEPFCQLLLDYDLQDQVLVASFHQSTIDEFRDTCPGVATSMVEDEIRVLYALNLVFLGGIFQAPAEAIQVPEYSGDLHVVTGQFVSAAQFHNVDVHVWTVNETDNMVRLLELGVDGIITDRPDIMLALLGRS